MIIADAAGSIQTRQRPDASPVGYAREQLIGTSIDLLVPANQRERLVLDRGAFATAPPARPTGAERELTACHKDGTQILVSVTASPVDTEDGTLILRRCA